MYVIENKLLNYLMSLLYTVSPFGEIGDYSAYGFTSMLQSPYGVITDYSETKQSIC